MAKNVKEYICQECGAIFKKWTGKCSECNSWNTLVESLPKESTHFSKLSSKKNSLDLKFENLVNYYEDTIRISTTINELDQVLGGGLVNGSVILIGGDPGIGKSTLLLQLMDKLSNQELGCVYVSGEESLGQISIRARRLGINNPDILMLSATNLESIISSIKNRKNINAVVIDSIQTMFIEQIPSAPGTVAQVRASAHELIRLAKEENITVIIVGHVTKEGQIAGPKVLEHMVDTVLYFEGESGHNFRILRAVKNRFGGVNEIGVFEMSDGGLSEVSNPSALFLSERNVSTSGSVIFAGQEGSRPILVEIQALVAPTFMASPRRAVIGWDSNRLAMVIAVLATRFGLNLTDKEVYLNIAGGLKVDEPGADLAVAAALISATTNVAIPQDMVIFGEIGLSGEIRAISQTETRIKEAKRLGFNQVVIPFSNKNKFSIEDINITQIKHIKQLKTIVFGS